MPSRMFGAAAEFVEKKYGGPTAELVATESVGTTQSEILRNDPERVFVLIVNLSVNTVHIGYDAGVSSTNGIQLSSNGGTYQTDVEEDFTVPIRAHHAVAGAANSTLYVLTVRRISKTPPVEA
ncbi:MAG: hypothetical protein ACE5OQ_11520 [Woeseia sp.]